MIVGEKPKKKDKSTKINFIENYEMEVPHIIKYMGSKREILPYIIKVIDGIYKKGPICDLFAGTTIVGSSLRNLVPIHSNDIQAYSGILANTYLSNYHWDNDNILTEILDKANTHVENVLIKYPELNFVYHDKLTIQKFNDLEELQKDLINKDFSEVDYHLFTKYYSGTYWSFKQCLWIDALRKVADDYIETPVYFVILSSLMYAMSYNSQSTGHYAQYRDATSKTSKDDILIYRKKEIKPYFISKFNQLKQFLGSNNIRHKVSNLDYRDCLDEIEEESLVYADPPYAFVHYSRFYHALETLVKYDFPEVLHKGRYRVDRHQSPFCKRTEVQNAFSEMFKKISMKKAQLILSYSNTGMIGLEEIISLASMNMDKRYQILVTEFDYKHSTMGRSDDKTKDVKEYLIIAKHK